VFNKLNAGHVTLRFYSFTMGLIIR
jgi:hypothetical protein